MTDYQIDARPVINHGKRTETEIRHNNQIDVVSALFEAGLINKV